MLNQLYQPGAMRSNPHALVAVSSRSMLVTEERQCDGVNGQSKGTRRTTLIVWKGGVQIVWRNRIVGLRHHNVGFVLKTLLNPPRCLWTDERVPLEICT
jgi:hypothetical protein